ncbi:hypothetical protein KC357_g33 [Hortaea werneckii]|nr:hypothetical protein KC357_g33 [Hortaea werneckii]
MYLKVLGPIPPLSFYTILILLLVPLFSPSPPCSSLLLPFLRKNFEVNLEERRRRERKRKKKGKRVNDRTEVTLDLAKVLGCEKGKERQRREFDYYGLVHMKTSPMPWKHELALISSKETCSSFPPPAFSLPV